MSRTHERVRLHRGGLTGEWSAVRVSPSGVIADIAQALADAGLLATARTRPTREDLILALAQADGQAWPDGMDDHTAEHMYGKQADAVLALLRGGAR